MIREGCISLVGITDRIICEFLDPLVLQPASLDVATVKKKPEEDLAIGHSVSNSFDGIDLWLQVRVTFRRKAGVRRCNIFNNLYRFPFLFFFFRLGHAYSNVLQRRPCGRRCKISKSCTPMWKNRGGG